GPCRAHERRARTAVAARRRVRDGRAAQARPRGLRALRLGLPQLPGRGRFPRGDREAPAQPAVQRAAAATGRRRRGRGRGRAWPRGRAVEEALSGRVRIVWLSAHPRHAAALAEAHVQVFGALLPGWTAEQALAELRAHDRPATVPSTLVALDGDGEWLGSVSLLAEDHPDIPQYSPWLASLYVRPEARGNGTGRALVARAVAEAAALGIGTLYLYCTPAVAGWYLGLGWRQHEVLHLGPLVVHVLAIDCREHA